MKKLILAAAVLGLAAVGTSTAHAGVRFSIGLPFPRVTVRAPVVVAAPARVYVAPAPVYVAPAPVYCPPPVVYSAPAYCAPAPRAYFPPVPSVRFDFGFGHFGPAYHHGYR